MPETDRTLTFTGHLEELRNRLMICVVALIVTTAIAFPLAKPAIGLLTKPLQMATTPANPPRIVLSMIPAPGEEGGYRITGRMGFSVHGVGLMPASATPGRAREKW